MAPGHAKGTGKGAGLTITLQGAIAPHHDPLLCQQGAWSRRVTHHPQIPIWGPLCYQSPCSAPHPTCGHLLRSPFPICQESAEMLSLEAGFRWLLRALPRDPAHPVGQLGSAPRSPLSPPGAPQPACPLSAALGQGHRAHSACQCEPAPHRIVAGTFISLILTIPSECLSTVSLGRPLYLLINLTDKRFSPVSILTSFSLNYIPIP